MSVSSLCGLYIIHRLLSHWISHRGRLAISPEYHLHFCSSDSELTHSPRKNSSHSIFNWDHPAALVERRTADSLRGGVSNLSTIPFQVPNFYWPKIFIHEHSLSILITTGLNIHCSSISPAANGIKRNGRSSRKRNGRWPNSSKPAKLWGMRKQSLEIQVPGLWLAVMWIALREGSQRAHSMHRQAKPSWVCAHIPVRW